MIGGLYADFSKSLGDTFHCKLYATNFIAEVIKKDFTLMKIHYYIPGGADEGLELTFMRNVGLINSYAVDWHWGYKLVKYDLR